MPGEEEASGRMRKAQVGAAEAEISQGLRGTSGSGVSSKHAGVPQETRCSGVTARGQEGAGEHQGRSRRWRPCAEAEAVRPGSCPGESQQSADQAEVCREKRSQGQH